MWTDLRRVVRTWHVGNLLYSFIFASSSVRPHLELLDEAPTRLVSQSIENSTSAEIRTFFIYFWYGHDNLGSFEVRQNYNLNLHGSKYLKLLIIVDFYLRHRIMKGLRTRLRAGDQASPLTRELRQSLLEADMDRRSESSSEFFPVNESSLISDPLWWSRSKPIETIDNQDWANDSI